MENQSLTLCGCLSLPLLAELFIPQETQPQLLPSRYFGYLCLRGSLHRGEIRFCLLLLLLLRLKSLSWIIVNGANKRALTTSGHCPLCILLGNAILMTIHNGIAYFLHRFIDIFPFVFI